MLWFPLRALFLGKLRETCRVCSDPESFFQPHFSCLLSILSLYKRAGLGLFSQAEELQERCWVLGSCVRAPAHTNRPGAGLSNGFLNDCLHFPALFSVFFPTFCQDCLLPTPRSPSPLLWPCSPPAPAAWHREQPSHFTSQWPNPAVPPDPPLSQHQHPALGPGALLPLQQDTILFTR